jgi:hypothetical protein
MLNDIMSNNKISNDKMSKFKMLTSKDGHQWQS